jgi:hypothetical protein
MWSCPFDFNLHKNWLGFAVTRKGINESKIYWPDSIYYEKNNDFEQQVIKEYYNDSRTLSLKNERIEIIGQMGTNHTPTARVIIRPTNRDDLPDSIIREFPQ